jgi:hypothetical protein
MTITTNIKVILEWEVLYLVTFGFIGCFRVIDRHETWDTDGHHLAILPDRAGLQDIVFFGPSDWYGVLRALAILMPCLGEKISYNAGLIIMASWVVRRPHLKWYLEHQLMNDIVINMCISICECTMVQLIGR